jgi:hypothetical protein
MEQHPLPRQITSFEFKLVGFMTLHQFIYLLIFIPLGFVVYRIISIGVVNIMLGLIVSSIGVLLAFLPVNDRPLDVFIKNLYKRLSSPTQYLYKKTNQPVSVLSASQDSRDPNASAVHVDSQDKLSRYMQSKNDPVTTTKKIVFGESNPELFSTKLSAKLFEEKSETTPSNPGANKPFFMGVIKNNREKPLPEILVYLKDQRNTPVRLLKTNPDGVFATYSALPQGEYLMEAKDPRGSYLFDTMKVQLGASNPAPFTMSSKGTL